MPFDDTAGASEAAAAVEAEAGPGATAILHGMLGTLAEVLGELDRRLVSIETAVRERAVEAVRPGAVEAVGETVTMAVEGVHDRIDRLAGALEKIEHALREAGAAPDDADDATFHALDAVAARLEDRLAHLEARLPTPEALMAPVTRLEALLRELNAAVAEGMLDLAARQARLVDEVQRVLAAERERSEAAAVAAAGAPAPEADLDRAALREELERLEVVLRGQAAELTGQARSVADVVGALDGRLRDVAEGVRGVAQHAGALAALPKRLEALREEVAGLTRGSGGVAHSA